MYSTYLGKVSEPGARPVKTMKRAKSLLLSGCCLVLNFLCHVQCEENQQYGDVSFKCPARQDENRHDANLRGQVTITLAITYGNSSIPRLEPFYVCYNYDDPYKSFNRGAAAAICRQKGFVDAEAVAINSMMYCGTPHMIGICCLANRRGNCPGVSKLESILVTPRSLWTGPGGYICSPKSNGAVRGLFISHVLCPNVSDYTRYGELHVMRCSVGEIIDSLCAPVSVICSSRKLDSYNGMISVADHDPSKEGLVKIHLFGSAKYICFPDNADVVGSSMCRQIGYTGASSVSPSSDWPRDGESAYQFSSVYCNNETGSYQCFSHCINQTEVTSSSDCQNVLSLACSYDPSIAELMTSGSLSVCSLQVSTNTSTSPYFISTIVLAAVFGVENIPICLICTVCLIKKYWRRRCHWWWHRQEYNDHNRPNANEHLALFQNNNNHN